MTAVMLPRKKHQSISPYVNIFFGMFYIVFDRGHNQLNVLS